jgi:UDP-glucose 4-epimerase
MVIEEMGLKNVKINYTGGDRGWPGDVPRFQLDPTKLSKLGWSAKYTSDEAIRKAIREIIYNQ